jgi:cell shape-determining protein MreC
MLIWIAKISIMSIIFIFLVHHLLSFFKSTLTVPKIKDLVNSPNQKYQNIYDTLRNINTNNNSNLYSSGDTNNSYSYTAIDLLPVSEDNAPTNSMKDELKSFLKKQLSNSN